MREFMLVTFGGALGSGLRFLTYYYAPLLFGRSSLITGTLIVNVVGCLLIGLLIQWMEFREWMDGALRLFILTGFLGGYTTFSAFGYESFELLRSSFSELLLYTGLHLFLGIGAVWIGVTAGQLLFKA